MLHDRIKTKRTYWHTHKHTHLHVCSCAVRNELQATKSVCVLAKKIVLQFLFLSLGFSSIFFCFFGSAISCYSTQSVIQSVQLSSVQSVSEFLCVNSVASRDKKNWIEEDEGKKFST